MTCISDIRVGAAIASSKSLRTYGSSQNREGFSKPGMVLRTGGSSENLTGFSEPGGVLKTGYGSENWGEF